MSTYVNLCLPMSSFVNVLFADLRSRILYHQCDLLVSRTTPDARCTITSIKRRQQHAIRHKSAMVRLTSWDRNGKDAAYIVAGIIDGRFDPENFDAFWKEHTSWQERYKSRRNVRTNYSKVAARLKTYLDTGTGTVQNQCTLLLLFPLSDLLFLVISSCCFNFR